MSEKLLPCPFCGGDADLIRAAEQVDEEQDIWTNPEMRTLWIVECNNQCCVYTDNQDQAIAAWNRRAE